MKTIELKLIYQDNLWHCYNEQISLKSKELSGLDTKIKAFLTKTYEEGRFKVKFYYDFNNFPLWMRQYMPHYFNRETDFSIE